MKRSIVCSLAFLVVSSPSFAQSAINLARLSTARVYASTERKGAHGIQKIFDGKTDTSWVSTDHDAWVRVRFTKPVSVSGIAIHANVAKLPSEPPAYYQLHLRHPGEKHFISCPLIKANNPTSSYMLPQAMEDVKDVWVVFPSPGPIHIDELEILGESASEPMLASMLPDIDATGQSFVRELRNIEKKNLRDVEKMLKKI